MLHAGIEDEQVCKSKDILNTVLKSWSNDANLKQFWAQENNIEEEIRDVLEGIGKVQSGEIVYKKFNVGMNLCWDVTIRFCR